MTRPLCIYHGHCDDGFAAAWCVRQAVPDAEFYPGVYQQQPPDVTDRDVLLVDFSYKRPVLLRMAESARSIMVLDHHKTAAEELSGFPNSEPFESWFDAKRPKVCALFDMSRSGATLAWDYFHAGKPRPLFIDYIEDRDLWGRQFPKSDLFTIALRSYPQDFEVWDDLVAAGPMPLIAEGESIQRYYRLRVEELKRNAYRAVLSGHVAWVANAPYFAASEVAGELAEREGGEFGACFSQSSNLRWGYSLRSRGDFDVSEIAKQFGGGGHKNAAGFAADNPMHLPVGTGP